MLIVDAHLDIAFNALAFGRDYRLHPIKHREREGYAHPISTTGLPDALLGRIAVAFATLFVEPDNGKPSPVPYAHVRYRNAREAYNEAMHQLDYYHRLADESGQIRLVQTAHDLESVLKTYEDGVPLNQRTQGLVVSFEGADPILEPRQFEEWYERGVRCVGLAWTATRYSGGTGAPGGLTVLGRELLEVLSSFNVIVDLAHSAEKAFFETLDAFQGTVIASHVNPRRFMDTDRHLSDLQIRRLAERGGVMGVVLLNVFLSKNWSAGSKKSTVQLSVVADVIDYVCQLTGSSQHVGIGSDFDGGFGTEAIPEGIDTQSDLRNIATILTERGYSDDDVKAIMGGNFLRQLRQVLK
jgi:membrane dipeptidase